PGRLTIARRDPWIVLDGAHNPDGAKALAASLSALFGTTPVTFVIGVYADKDARGILEALRPLAERLIFTRARGERAADPSALAALVSGGPPTSGIPSVAEALSVAAAAPGTAIVWGAG